MENWQCTWPSSQKLTSRLQPLKLHSRNLHLKYKQWRNHKAVPMRLML